MNVVLLVVVLHVCESLLHAFPVVFISLCFDLAELHVFALLQQALHKFIVTILSCTELANDMCKAGDLAGTFISCSLNRIHAFKKFVCVPSEPFTQSFHSGTECIELSRLRPFSLFKLIFEIIYSYFSKLPILFQLPELLIGLDQLLIHQFEPLLHGLFIFLPCLVQLLNISLEQIKYLYSFSFLEDSLLQRNQLLIYLESVISQFLEPLLVFQVRVSDRLQ